MSKDCPNCGFSKTIETCEHGEYCTRCPYNKPKSNDWRTKGELRHEATRARARRYRQLNNETTKRTYRIR